MQRQFRGTPFDLAEREFVEKRDRILIQLEPARWIEVAKQRNTLMIPTPPQVARERPKAFLRRSDEAIEGARLADHRRHFARGLREHANLVVAKHARILGLHNQNALQNAAIDQRNAEKRVVIFFAGFLEIFEARMIAHIVNGHGLHLLGNQAGEAFMQRHAQGADAARMQTDRRRQDKV